MVCFVQYISFFMLCKGRVAIYGMLQVCLSEDSPAWLDSFQLLLEICHLLGTEGMFITVSRVTLAEAKKRLSYIMERAGSKDKKFIQCVLRTPAAQAPFLSCVPRTDREWDHGYTGLPTHPQNHLRAMGAEVTIKKTNNLSPNFSFERKRLVLPTASFARPVSSQRSAWLPIKQRRFKPSSTCTRSARSTREVQCGTVLTGAERHQPF